MSDFYGSIRVLVKQDGTAVLDETFPNPEPRLRLVGKSFWIEAGGQREKLEISFEFSPSLIASPDA